MKRSSIYICTVTVLSNLYYATIRYLVRVEGVLEAKAYEK